jgi:RNA polymerase-binding transcription factor DksA
MLAEHEERFNRIASEFLERPAGDYAELLRRGQVSSPDGVNPEQWREDIRRQARQDNIRVITTRDGDNAFAMLNRKIPDDQAMQAMRQALDQTTLLSGLARQSAELGHEMSSWLGHHDESIAFCEQCGARIYVRRGTPNVQDGEALNNPCPSPPD